MNDDDSHTWKQESPQAKLLILLCLNDGPSLAYRISVCHWYTLNTNYCYNIEVTYIWLSDEIILSNQPAYIIKHPSTRLELINIAHP